MIVYQPEVDGSTVVRIKCSKDVLAEVFCISTGKVSIKKIYCVFFKPGKDLWIHGNELFLAEFPAGAVLQETLIPFLQLTNDAKVLLRMVSVKFPVLSMSTHMRVLGFPSTAAWHDSEVPQLPHGQNDWPFWTTLDPFGPLWNIDKPCHVLEIWDALCYCRLHFKDKLVDDSAKLWGR